jgi:hypothetical protein
MIRPQLAPPLEVAAGELGDQQRRGPCVHRELPVVAFGVDRT